MATFPFIPTAKIKILCITYWTNIILEQVRIYIKSVRNGASSQPRSKSAKFHIPSYTWNRNKFAKSDEKTTPAKKPTSIQIVNHNNLSLSLRKSKGSHSKNHPFQRTQQPQITPEKIIQSVRKTQDVAFPSGSYTNKAQTTETKLEKLTIFIHSRLKAFGQSTCSTLIPVGLVNWTPAFKLSRGFTRVDSISVNAALKKSRASCGRMFV